MNLFKFCLLFCLVANTAFGQQISKPEAARFLMQATLGADYELIDRVSQIGYEVWLEEQFNAAPTYHTPRVLQLQLTDDEEGIEFSHYIWSWWDVNMKAQDLLRQRVAFALSEILVISMVGVDIFEDVPHGIALYYDILVDGAFDNYENTLYRVSTNPAMGHYLSHARNRKADPSVNRYPDENYAREVMQLFTIGLYQLSQDGQRQKDAFGNDVPTYTNADIREFARVFTGMTFDPRPVPGLPDFSEPDEVNQIASEDDFIRVEPVFVHRPMFHYEPMHDSDPKQLLSYNDLNGNFVSGAISGDTVEQDVRAAINNLFNHPNVGPFIGYRLIQRLVKSNPSSGYINRVANAFHDNGSGVRGDMRAVIRAILLDPEARGTDQLANNTHGMLREPYVRYIQFARAFNTSVSSNAFRNESWASEWLKQQPMQAPSVFNFFLPTYAPVGPITDANLVAPEFQIHTSTSALSSINFWIIAVYGDYILQLDDVHPVTAQHRVTIDFSDEFALAGDIPALLDRLNLIMCAGNLSQQSRNTITDALNQARAVTSDEQVVRLAIFLVMNTPDYAIQR